MRNCLNKGNSLSAYSVFLEPIVADAYFRFSNWLPIKQGFVLVWASSVSEVSIKRLLVVLDEAGHTRRLMLS